MDRYVGYLYYEYFKGYVKNLKVNDLRRYRDKYVITGDLTTKGKELYPTGHVHSMPYTLICKERQ